MTRISKLLSIGCLLGCPAVLPGQDASATADLIVTARRIYTVDETRPIAEAMAIRDGRIVFVGSERGALALEGADTRMVRYPNRTIIPGMIDAHAHLSGLGRLLRQVNLAGTTSYDQVIARVVERAKAVPPGTWIVGRGWDQNDWGERQFPTHEGLSRAVPEHPVVLSRVDGHALLANAKAMALARVNKATKERPGGRIVRLPSGDPSGVFVDNAQGLVRRLVPSTTRDEVRLGILAAIKEVNRWGITGIHDAGVSRSTIEIYEELAQAGQFTLRDYVMINSAKSTRDYFFAKGPQNALYDGHLWIRSIKLFMDGALGSRGAALLDPYSDDPDNSGLLVSTPEHIREVSEEALRNGFQVCVHAIGDRGNRVVLDQFEAALNDVPVADHRFRIEHAQIFDNTDIPRFAELDVIPSMQSTHATSDMYWAGSRLGTDRLHGAYAWRSLLRTGVIVPNGTDAPVEPIDPMRTFHSAISRQDENNYPEGGWYPEQRMTRDEALKSMTIWAAAAGFQEDLLGSLAPGKYADFVVLDQDIMTVAPEDILATEVLATYVGGRPVYERD